MCINGSTGNVIAAYTGHLERGASVREAWDAVNAAIEAGTLTTATPGTLIFIQSGPSRAESAHLAVTLVPYATAEATGLPTRPTADRAWLMCPGTARAHIMLGRCRTASIRTPAGNAACCPGSEPDHSAIRGPQPAQRTVSGSTSTVTRRRSAGRRSSAAWTARGAGGGGSPSGRSGRGARPSGGDRRRRRPEHLVSAPRAAHVRGQPGRLLHRTRERIRPYNDVDHGQQRRVAHAAAKAHSALKNGS